MVDKKLQPPKGRTGNQELDRWIFELWTKVQELDSKATDHETRIGKLETP